MYHIYYSLFTFKALDLILLHSLNLVLWFNVLNNKKGLKVFILSNFHYSLIFFGRKKNRAGMGCRWFKYKLQNKKELFSLVIDRIKLEIIKDYDNFRFIRLLIRCIMRCKIRKWIKFKEAKNWSSKPLTQKKYDR